MRQIEGQYGKFRSFTLYCEEVIRTELAAGGRFDFLLDSGAETPNVNTAHSQIVPGDVFGKMNFWVGGLFEGRDHSRGGPIQAGAKRHNLLNRLNYRGTQSTGAQMIQKNDQVQKIIYFMNRTN